MKPVDVTKKGKQLPTRTALTSLDQGQRTINDYAKLSPIKSEEPVAVVMQNLRKP
jgi:hypothetical protein